MEGAGGRGEGEKGTARGGGLITAALIGALFWRHGSTIRKPALSGLEKLTRWFQRLSVRVKYEERWARG